MNSFIWLGVLRQATRRDLEKLVHAVNNYGSTKLDPQHPDLALALACVDHNELVAAGRKMCEDYGENLPILEEIAARVREGEDD
jgi:hypothetical protein